MKIRIVPVAAGLAGATALAITGAAFANADPGTTAPTTTAAVAASGSATTTPQPPQGNGNTDPSRPMRSDEQLLTGTTAQKVTAAAKAKEPGATIQRVETDSDGVYEAHMVRSDGTPIIVQVGKDFTVTGVIEGGGPGGGRPGAPGSPGGSSSSSATPSST
jgi:hypothetical protein